jgi:hypothetical protein
MINGERCVSHWAAELIAAALRAPAPLVPDYVGDPVVASGQHDISPYRGGVVPD